MVSTKEHGIKKLEKKDKKMEGKREMDTWMVK